MFKSCQEDPYLDRSQDKQAECDYNLEVLLVKNLPLGRAGPFISTSIAVESAGIQVQTKSSNITAVSLARVLSLMPFQVKG